jgi:hypothetical protein
VNTNLGSSHQNVRIGSWSCEKPLLLGAARPLPLTADVPSHASGAAVGPRADMVRKRYSITSSAVASIASGMRSPNAFAVLRLM